MVNFVGVKDYAVINTRNDGYFVSIGRNVGELSAPWENATTITFEDMPEYLGVIAVMELAEAIESKSVYELKVAARRGKQISSRSYTLSSDQVAHGVDVMDAFRKLINCTIALDSEK